jgi:hypothetical protein
VRNVVCPFNIISNAVTWLMYNTGGVADVRISIALHSMFRTRLDRGRLRCSVYSSLYFINV